MFIFYLVIVCFFFFSSRRRHTRYWRDWSSDVCSSDLRRRERLRERIADDVDAGLRGDVGQVAADAGEAGDRRSEERRVGKECRSRWSAYHLKKKDNNRCVDITSKIRSP